MISLPWVFFCCLWRRKRRKFTFFWDLSSTLCLSFGATSRFPGLVFPLFFLWDPPDFPFALIDFPAPWAMVIEDVIVVGQAGASLLSTLEYFCLMRRGGLIP